MIPSSVRKAVKRRAGGCCEDCGDRTRLELHHLRYTLPDMYEPDGIDIRGRETEGDLVALCRQCHFQRHIDPAGEFWRDPEEMEHYWITYHEEAL